MLLQFAQRRLRKAPSTLVLEDIGQYDAVDPANRLVAAHGGTTALGTLPAAGTL
jgi:hypothetical protein